MPAKNTIKQFEPEAMYHVYNRGVDKRIIFVDEQDYSVFLSFLKYALLPREKTEGIINPIEISESSRFNLRRLGLNGQLELVAFCLMPNHFHLLIFQHSIDAITKLMRSIATAYSMYFNKKYDRSGTLFQGRYKASAVNTDAYWNHISRYIHLNPKDLGVDWRTYTKSSFRIYSNKAEAEWLKPSLVLDAFKSLSDYEKFVVDYEDHHDELKQTEKELGL